MPKQDFDELMDTWAEHEAESAPELHPTAEMYRLVEAKKKQERTWLAVPRWLKAGLASAALIVLAILSALQLQPALRFTSQPSQEIAFLGQREGYRDNKGVPVLELVPSKGDSQRGPEIFEQLILQIERPNAESLIAVDLRYPLDDPLMITLDDNYRLLIESSEARHIYIFHLSPVGDLGLLYPNKVISSERNPLQKGDLVYLPSEPNWFYLKGETGEHRLYVVAAPEKLGELEDLFQQYQRSESAMERITALTSLIDYLELSLDAYVEKWEFTFVQTQSGE